MPLEYYPPVTNLLDIIHQRKPFTVKVYSTHNTKHRPVYNRASIPVYRSDYPAYVANPLLKIWAYLQLVIKPLWYMWRFRPDAILYYEPHSAAPAYLYKRYFRSRVKVFIHNHEYYAPEEFNEAAMGSIRFFHHLERTYLYKKAVWISQTNRQRLALFHKDYPFIPSQVLHTLANYPPESWQKHRKSRLASPRVRLLYIGALSFENTHIKSVVDFVLQHQDQMSLDIYAYNVSQEVQQFLEGQDEEVIRYFKAGVNYIDIPNIAQSFDIGLVLYNGHNLNYIYNAPNKLFEYLACGLNVWVPEELAGCRPYLNSQNRPQVLSLNYNELDSSLISTHLASLELPLMNTTYYCNQELQPLIQALS
ncbi:hypothetical protein IX84_20150 [Phaeodactylibacter xiamenensis]|uniref:Glycosyltransferase subfamily 4-like N-terminal domain-containing protein n=1 Tax=Phaeodactylibacter xiamenensis TaxID=1524460 RepID=A0A098S2L1_9BACT|nr:hypothetical protein IX84_20150 [Phaeodactylibacter xiamenensis]